MKLLNYIFLSTLIFNFSAQAQVMGKILPDSVMKKYDLNFDKKIDRIEYYKDNKLIRLEEDRNSDEKFDYVEIHDHPVFYLMIEQDTNFDGKVDLKKSYSKLKNNTSKVSISMDNNYDGVFETSFSEIVNDHQQEAACVRQKEGNVSKFITSGTSITKKIPGGFYPTGVGIKIENECLQKWGSSFEKTVKDTVHQGMRCLNALGKKSKTSMNGAQRNAFGLSQLFQGDKISLVCSDKSYDWKNVNAYASASKNEKIKGKNISHPFVVLNPSYPKEALAKRAEESKQIKATIFHEMLHNLGYRHSESIEFSYTCETCCFTEGKSAARNVACKICMGNYSNEFDPNYLEDFVAFGRETSNESFALSMVLRTAKIRKKNLDSISLIAEASSGVFNPMGPELAKIIKANHPQSSTSRFEGRLKNAIIYESMSEFKASQKTNNVLARSLYELYFNHDGAKSMALLKENKETIKKELTSLRKKGGNSQWVADELAQSLDKVIYEVWVNKFPNDKASMDGYNLHLYFNKK